MQAAVPTSRCHPHAKDRGDKHYQPRAPTEPGLRLLMAWPRRMPAAQGGDTAVTTHVPSAASRPAFVPHHNLPGKEIKGEEIKLFWSDATGPGKRLCSRFPCGLTTACESAGIAFSS